MPPKKRNYKKPYKKRRYAKKTTGLSLRVPKPRVVPFSRSSETLVELDNPSSPWITTLEGSVVRTFDFALNGLPNSSEFANLFGQYKLNMAIVTFYPSASQVVVSTGGAATQNMIITVWPNTHGVPLTATFANAHLLEISRKKQWMFPMNKPTSIKMYLKQLSEMYAGTLNTDYVTCKPRYISTSETSLPHYGMNVHIRKLDGTSFGNLSPRLLVKERVYLTCKQVQ